MKIPDKCWAFLLELEWWVVGGSAAAVVVASMVARRRCLNGKWYWWSCSWCWWSDGGVSGHDVVMTSQCPPWWSSVVCGLVIIEMLDVWMHTSIWSWRPSFWITYNIFWLFFNKNKNCKNKKLSHQHLPHNYPRMWVWEKRRSVHAEVEIVQIHVEDANNNIGWPTTLSRELLSK